MSKKKKSLRTGKTVRIEQLDALYGDYIMEKRQADAIKSIVAVVVVRKRKSNVSHDNERVLKCIVHASVASVLLTYARINIVCFSLPF